MKLTNRNLFVRFYKFNYKKYPNDLCSLFWKTILGLIFLPFYTIGLLLKPTHYIEGVGTGLILSIITLACISLGNAIVYSYGYEFINIFWSIVGGLFTGLLVVVITFIIILALIIVVVNLIVKGAYKTSRTNIVVTAKDTIAAVRGKYCTKIEIKDEKS